MNSQSLACPACGAALTLENRFSKVVVCAYCNQTAYVEPQGLSGQGQSATLAESFSLLSVGATGRLQGRPFKVLGRLRYQYDRGFWDEWFLSMESEQNFVWLEEDEGEFTAYRKEPIANELPDLALLQVGSSYRFGERKVFITELLKANIEGAEGELFFKVLPGEEVTCIDGLCAGQVLAIEVTPHEVELSLGETIDLDEIELADE